jgi:hypothetical protein
MGATNAARHCRECGARLARDNGGVRCTPCQRRHHDLRATPPDVPTDFWNADLMRDTLDTWHIGKVIRAYRRHPFFGNRPPTQELVAGWLGLTQAQLSRIESGSAVTDLAKLTTWTRILRIPSHLLWFKLPGDHAMSEQGPTPQQGRSTDQRKSVPRRLLAERATAPCD